MNKQRLWLQVAAFLALVWGALAVVLWWTEDHVFTPEKTLVLMNESPWYVNERLGPRQRGTHLDKVIASVSRLTYNQRETMREDGAESVDRFMKSLTEDEKGEYISRIVEQTFLSVMKGIEKLPPEERRRVTGAIQRDMKKRGTQSPEMQLLLDQSAADFEKALLKDAGMFFKQAPLATKLEMAPLLEGMQARILLFAR
ncbi:MAG: hypothetical protein IPK32_10125 [Verrucomicrobiaceae bacterium]|nr:hypothetical protein [Verrucomicrobiaceae bacterium]